MKFYLYRNSQTYGPYSEESLLEYLHSGKVSENDWACRKGEKKWVRLSDLMGTVGDQENSTIETDDLTEEQVQEYKEKIEDLVSSNEENFAIDLVRSINSPRLYEELLKDCSIDEQGCPDLEGWWQDNKDKELLPFFLGLISYCPEEASIHSSLKRESITDLRLRNSSSLSNVDVLSNLTNLTNLNLFLCISLSNVDGLSGLTNLTSLGLSCSSLTNVDGLSNLTNLTELSLSCESLTNVDVLSNLTNLTELSLSCESLTNVDVLSNLTNLKGLNLEDCTSLSNVDGLSNLTNLTELVLNRCTSLTDVDGLSNLPNLIELDLEENESLTNVDGLSCLTNLKELNLVDCTSLSNVDVLSNLTNLTELYLEGCESLAEDQIDDLKAALPSCSIYF